MGSCRSSTIFPKATSSTVVSPDRPDTPRSRALPATAPHSTATQRPSSVPPRYRVLRRPAAPPVAPPPRPSLALLSGREIDVPAGTAEITSYALMGGDSIDLCAVMGPGVTIELNCYAMWAGHDVYVPPGVRIRDETVNIMAGNEIHRAARGDGSNGTLILKGFSLMAGHDVRLAKGYRAKDQGQLE